MSLTPSPWARWWSSSGLSGDAALDHEAARAALEHEATWSRLPVSGPGVGDELHAEGGLEECAVWVALPTTNTTASQPVTGNGSAGVVVDQSDQLVELLGQSSAARSASVRAGKAEVGASLVMSAWKPIETQCAILGHNDVHCARWRPRIPGREWAA